MLNKLELFVLLIIANIVLFVTVGTGGAEAYIRDFIACAIVVTICVGLGLLVIQMQANLIVYLIVNTPVGVLLWILINISLFWLYRELNDIDGILMLIGIIVIYIMTCFPFPKFHRAHRRRVGQIPKLQALLDKSENSSNWFVHTVARFLVQPRNDWID